MSKQLDLFGDEVEDEGDGAGVDLDTVQPVEDVMQLLRETQDKIATLAPLAASMLTALKPIPSEDDFQDREAHEQQEDGHEGTGDFFMNQATHASETFIDTLNEIQANFKFAALQLRHRRMIQSKSTIANRPGFVYLTDARSLGAQKHVEILTRGTLQAEALRDLAPSQMRDSGDESRRVII